MCPNIFSGKFSHIFLQIITALFEKSTKPPENYHRTFFKTAEKFSGKYAKTIENVGKFFPNLRQIFQQLVQVFFNGISGNFFETFEK